MKVKRRVRWLLVGAAFVGVMLIVVAVQNFASQSSPFLTISSPQGSYTVNFTGRKTQPHLPIIEYSVRFNVLKEGHQIVSHRHFHSGDWLDPSFDTLFPQHQWLNENILQLYREQYRKDLPLDRVTLINGTDSTITYLKVDSIDAVILLEIQPRSKSEFLVSRARSDFKSVSVVGEFAGGRVIGGGAALGAVNRTDPLIYRIIVSQDGAIFVRD